MSSVNAINSQNKCIRCKGQYKLVNDGDFLLFANKKFLQLRDFMAIVNMKGLKCVMPYSICEECVNIFAQCHNLTRCDCSDKAELPLNVIHIDNFEEDWKNLQINAIEGNLDRIGKEEHVD